MATEASPWLVTLKGFLAGALTGVVGVVLPYPFESYRLKVLFARNKKVKVPSLLDQKVWRGLSGALMQGVALRGVTFGTYDMMLRFISGRPHAGGGLKDPVWHHGVAGGGNQLTETMHPENPLTHHHQFDAASREPTHTPPAT